MKVEYFIQKSVTRLLENTKFIDKIFQDIFAQKGVVLLVGGAVRDILLQQKTKDLDFEVYGISLESLQKILEKYGPVSLVGKSFGVLRLHGYDIDWSIPRKDSSGRHPKVSCSPWLSYEQAFARRDVTINAMGINMQTFELIDPFGGRQDLQDGVLRSPDLEFFAQDPLRVLRVMQLLSRFMMCVDSKLHEKCKTISLLDVSYERVEQEFTKLLLQGVKPSQGFLWLDELGRLQEFLPYIVDKKLLYTALDRGAALLYRTDDEKLMVMWAIIAWCCKPLQKPHTFERITKDELHQLFVVLDEITLQDKKEMLAAKLALYASMLERNVTAVQLKWLAHWLSPHLTLEMVFCVWEATSGDFHAMQGLKIMALKLGILHQEEKPLLVGSDLMRYAQGPELGLLLKGAYGVQLEESITDKKVLLEKMKLS